MPPLTPPQIAALRAALDRLIPADDAPGALATGTDLYLLRQLTGDCASDLPLIAAGLIQLDATATRLADGRTFAALTHGQQNSLLASLEAARDPFFYRLVDLAHEGFYADPANGGNRDAASWRMLGYDPLGTAARGPIIPPPPPSSPP